MPRFAADLLAATRRLAARTADLAVRRRWWVVGGLVVVQWAIVAHEALGSIPHNGWLYYNGDDAPWYWTSAYTLAHLHVPQTLVGLGWPVVLAPLAAIFGPDMANGLPAVIVLNVVVLGAAAVVGIYLVGERIAGRLFGLWATVVWVVAPSLGIALYVSYDRPTLVDYFMPTGRGLNALSDYPSMVVVIFAAYFTLRALESGALQDAVLCGVVTGFLIEVKPANGPFAVAAAAALLAASRWRTLAVAAAAMVPALVALTLWKHTGQGNIPLLAAGTAREAAGVTREAIALPQTDKYLNLDWHHLLRSLRDFQEVFWSVRLLEFGFFGGTIGLLIRSWRKGLLVVAWFVLFAIVKGTFQYANVEDASLYRFLQPAWPAWILMLAGIAYLWPVGPGGRARRSRDDGERARRMRPVPRVLAAVIVVALALVPLAFAAAATTVPKGSVAFQTTHGSLIAVVDFNLQAHVVRPGVVRLTWNAIGTSRASSSYLVFKDRTDGCSYPGSGAQQCNFDMKTLHSTPLPSFVDTHAHGRLVYRVGLAATWRVDPNTDDLQLLSTPVTVDVP